MGNAATPPAQQWPEATVLLLSSGTPQPPTNG